MQYMSFRDDQLADARAAYSRPFFFKVDRATVLVRDDSRIVRAASSLAWPLLESLATGEGSTR
jgi:hypothetical protein